MGDNDREIFARLRDIGEGVARIDERTERIDRDMRDHHADHESRIRRLEFDSEKRKGVAAAVGAIATLVVNAVIYLVKFLTGGAQ